MVLAVGVVAMMQGVRATVEAAAWLAGNNDLFVSNSIVGDNCGLHSGYIRIVKREC